MKAQPLRIIDGRFTVCEPKEADHLKFKMPGPIGILCLPVMIGGTREGTRNWTWNGSTDRPTLRPSLLTKQGDIRCHSWINDGQVQFLDDTNHDLRNTTVELLDLEPGDLS